MQPITDTLCLSTNPGKTYILTIKDIDIMLFSMVPDCSSVSDQTCALHFSSVGGRVVCRLCQRLMRCEVVVPCHGARCSHFSLAACACLCVPSRVLQVGQSQTGPPIIKSSTHMLPDRKTGQHAPTQPICPHGTS